MSPRSDSEDARPTPQTDSTATDDNEISKDQLRRVRVWFGDEVICSHCAEPGEAEQYARLMAQRFAGLTVTVDDQPGEKDTRLPHELLWDRTVR